MDQILIYIALALSLIACAGVVIPPRVRDVRAMRRELNELAADHDELNARVNRRSKIEGAGEAREVRKVKRDTEAALAAEALALIAEQKRPAPFPTDKAQLRRLAFPKAP